MKVVVVGAGPAGASAAAELRAAGAQVVVLEADDVVGGRTQRRVRDGFTIDTGAIFVMGSYDSTLAYLADSGLQDEMTRWHARAATLDESGRKQRVRFDRPWSFVRMPELSIADRVRVARRLAPLVAGRNRGPFDADDLAELDDGSSLERWALDNLGAGPYEYVVRPLMGPLTGADPKVISAAFTRALMTRLARSRLTVPIGGMARISERLLEGVDVRTSTPVLGITDDGVTVEVTTADESIVADAVVVATDVRSARQLLSDVAPPAVLSALDEVVSIPAHHVVLGYREDPWPDADHDLVVHAHPGPHPNYGVLMNSRRSQGSVPDGGQYVSVWFDHGMAAPGLTEDDLVDLALEGVAAAFGSAPEPDFAEVFSWDTALIAPVPGHYAAMREARDAMPPRVRLAGDFLTHSGVEGARLAGLRAARDLLAPAGAGVAPAGTGAVSPGGRRRRERR